jgi:hypothetical protein
MVKSTALRVLLSAIAGLFVFYAIALLTNVLGRGSDWLFNQYIDIFGLLSLVVRLIDPEYNPPEEMGTPLGYNVAAIIRLLFWISLFGFIFFRFVFRPRQPSNQPMQRTPTRRSSHISNDQSTSPPINARLR